MALTLAVVPGCQLARKRDEPKPLARCMEELDYVPEIAGFLKARGQEESPNGSRPLAGLELALTINEMLKSHASPEENPDDWCYAENSPENLDKLINALKENSMPPTVSFVVGRDADMSVQERWLQSGNLVGNMTYSRIRVRKKSAASYVEDVERNDQLLAPLWEKYPHEKKYFRFIRLNPGPDRQKQAEIRNYLKRKDYVEVPATIYSPDRKLSQVYCSALARGDQTCANYIKASLKSFLLDSTLRARNLAGKIHGQEARHILVVGANQLICDSLGDILRLYKGLGARFISLDEALKDPLYSSVNERGESVAAEIIRRTRRGQLSATKEKASD